VKSSDFPRIWAAGTAVSKILEIFLRIFFSPGHFPERLARVEPAIVPEKTSLPAN
jgi:hypothetical protein